MGKPFSHSFIVEGRNFVQAGTASTKIKTMLKELGIDGGVVRRVAIATYEAEMNIVMYANSGTVVLEVTPEVVRLNVNDRGPGISDIDLAMQEGYSTATPEMREMGFGAGMGLPNIKKNADDLRIKSTVGEGTNLEITFRIN
ncbi:MAG: anti-sigma regulatory factor [Ignavibacteria bacterium]|nr:anti-sigma regulatory factor [Ignavibacteria bacterium]